MATAVRVAKLFRLPSDLSDRLEVRAQSENKSLNSLVVSWLRRALDAGW